MCKKETAGEMRHGTAPRSVVHLITALIAITATAILMPPPAGARR